MENKIIFITRYFTIFIIILGISLTETENLSFLSIALTLIFIINTQLRYFLFRDKLVRVFISILLDFIIGYISYTNYSGLLLPSFIMGIVDSFFLISYFSKYFLSSIGNVIFIYT